MSQNEIVKMHITPGLITHKENLTRVNRAENKFILIPAKKKTKKTKKGITQVKNENVHVLLPIFVVIWIDIFLWFAFLYYQSFFFNPEPIYTCWILRAKTPTPFESFFFVHSDFSIMASRAQQVRNIDCGCTPLPHQPSPERTGQDFKYDVRLRRLSTCKYTLLFIYRYM